MMLLNLSNHPSVSWSKEQFDAAVLQYSSIEDLAFPHIAPDATTEEVTQLAQTYFEKIDPKIASCLAMTNAVHLMGEMTFVYALVGILQRAGIQVVCSTTQRTVLEERDGKKTAQFSFVQFRAYPSF